MNQTKRYLSSVVLAKYSLSIRPSIRFLITTGWGRNLDFNCSVTYKNPKVQFQFKIVIHAYENGYSTDYGQHKRAAYNQISAHLETEDKQLILLNNDKSDFN